ncbi:MAG: ABC transporter ATP-binding protein/permease [Clostridia bacterium]|nr:ABC transporter ATP-binding protein/permease [Clostridia bacterium]
MLKLENIVKTYALGDTEVHALKGVSLQFRRNEFVSVLGPSGCGKTTLLNIVGGLDRYTSGDLSVNGVSTKKFTDGDWDAYRNHSIGFVFQSYNLIPHQTVLANVELALTLSGVSKAERTRRAKEVLERVGLGDQLKKKPNQMSGGQMQRVAIARALINNPEILLADEPTGALDSTTSEQIMDLLREIAKDKLVIMVTHNPELAEQYSTRIIRLLDGEVQNDSNPYDGEEVVTPAAVDDKVARRAAKKARKKRSMSYFTAISLSLNNLMTKKGRTILTSFAGSIGIIGIALILSLSTGINAYINQVQEDTLSSYPISLQAESVDMSALMLTLMGNNAEKEENAHPLDKVYGSQITYEMWNDLNSAETTLNNLKDFKVWLESENCPLTAYTSAIQYQYAVKPSIYTKDKNGKIVKSDVEQLMQELMKSMYGGVGSVTSSSMYQTAFSNISVWQEMLAGKNGEPVSDLVKGQYDVLAGKWPESYNEIVLIVDKNNEISDLVMYALGLETAEHMEEIMQAALNQQEIDTSNQLAFSYDEILAMEFKMLLEADTYQKNADGSYTDLTATEAGLDILYNGSDKAVKLRVVGILRQNADAAAGMLGGGIGYTAALTDYMIDKTMASDLIAAQLADKTVDVLTGKPFKPAQVPTLTDAEKTQAVKDFIAKLTTAEKATLYAAVMATPSEAYLSAKVTEYLGNTDRAALEQMIIQSYSQQAGVTDTSTIEKYIGEMDDETLFSYAAQMVRQVVTEQYAAAVQAQLGGLSGEQLAMMLDGAVANDTFTAEQYAAIYENHVPSPYSESTYEDTLTALGHVDKSSPAVIQLFASSFENKDMIAEAIADYNVGKHEDDQITYTDYVALLMSSITTIINAISYVLIAFVAISLVVSSIMIGIITYISVLERTREIGILRAIGASKRDVSRVFNAETLLVGLVAGLMGIGITLLLIIPINIIIRALTEISTLGASLPPVGAAVLVGVSVVMTMVAGLIPARVAARKDPVEALRSE